MRLTEAEIKHIAALARIGITNREVGFLRGQLSKILDHFDILQQVNTEESNSTSHFGDQHTVMRSDEAKESMPIEEVLANAPQMEGPHIKVRSILG